MSNIAKFTAVRGNGLEFLAKYEMAIYDVMDVLLEQYENGQLQNYKFAVSVESSSTVSATETLPGPVI